MPRVCREGRRDSVVVDTIQRRVACRVRWVRVNQTMWVIFSRRTSALYPCTFLAQWSNLCARNIYILPYTRQKCYI